MLCAWNMIACRTGVIFCIFQGNRGESEVNAKRELLGIAKKSRLSPHHNSSCSGVQMWTRLKHVILECFSKTLHDHVQWFESTTDPFTQEFFGEFNWKYGPIPGWGGGGYSLTRAYWGRAASQGVCFGIFVLNWVSNLSFFVLIRVSVYQFLS